jgi:hypothetical protein
VGGRTDFVSALHDVNLRPDDDVRVWSKIVLTLCQNSFGYRAKRAWLVAFAALAIAGSAGSASAQGFFDVFNNNSRRWSHPPAYADPFPQFNPFGQRAPETPRVEGGGSTAFCVRTCDGRYFPIARNTGTTPAQTCGALCPAAATKIYHGGSIEHASANGQRYADLSNAFVYREKIVPGCTCNGKDAFGLVTLNVSNDPTLHAGDIVATNSGLVAVTGGRKQAAEFAPIESYSGLAAELRQRLAETKVVPSDRAPVSVPIKPVETTASVAVSKNKRAQTAPRSAYQQQQQQQRWWFW